MNDTKKNHYLHQSYLKAFSFYQSQVYTSVVQRRNKDMYGMSKVGPKSVGSICFFEDGLTDYSKESPDRETGEKFFQSKFEDNWTKLLQEVLPLQLLNVSSFPKCNISEETRNTLVHFLIYNYKRSTRCRLDSQERYINAFNSKLKDQTDLIKHQTLLSFAFQLQPATEYVVNFSNWFFVFNQSDTPFITSNSPIIWHDDLKIEGVPALWSPMTPWFAVGVQLSVKEESRVMFKFADQDLVEKCNHHQWRRVVDESLVNHSRLIANNKEYLERLINSHR